ncbi:extracellular solute-binding protein [Paenibacillus mucilaginosus]|uniref:Extracellular solute-binding protein family 1 n=1 Tax=Paenibacillus mucilaginosus (strain KNP414) TaxID=1036673 RepID=F8FH06_PAEMK|nr:extracellular solute-binding protein [Paenibacillus mucilaginosus]AEI46307.1 extracellular solute-binding protein family 1 [Paenibacillus mucilaginosus KNP414]MCG7213578.1 extracellular solute-binding protein [Paenibacillus mucilaginosus]WDM27607.1 extracellular solute-binding protein [Paenibacillus mucilaginosus]
MKKSHGSLLLVTTLTASMVTACANPSSAPSDQSGNSSAPAGPAKITIMANLHTAEVPSDTIEKMVEEKTNTELTIQWVPDGSYEEKLNAAFATGSLPQATYLKNQTSLLMFRDAIRGGQFWEIGPLLKDYPNLKNLDPNVLNNTSVDGKIYSLYQERPLSRQGVIYRKDWADALGLPEPKTTEDLYQMMKAFKEKDPDKNGKNDTMGLTDRNDLVYGAFKTVASYYGTPNGWGEKDGKLAPEFMFPQYLETMKYFQRLHKEGLINQDFPVTSKTDQQNLFITGKAGMYIGSLSDSQSLYQKLITVNPNMKLDVANRITGPEGKAGIWAIPGYGSAVLFPKSAVKTEAELKQILSFYDKLMGAELGNLIYHGIEGKHFTLVEGKVAQVDDLKLTDREIKPYQALQVGGENTIKGFKESYFKIPVKDKAEKLVKDNNSILIHDPTAPLDSKTYTEKGARLQEGIKDATYKFILGAIDEAGFRSAVEKWQKEGGDKIIEEYNASYQQSKK